MPDDDKPIEPPDDGGGPLPVDDDDLEHITLKGIPIGELRRRHRGESGTPEEQAEARAELARFSEQIRTSFDRLSNQLSGQIKSAAAGFQLRPSPGPPGGRPPIMPRVEPLNFPQLDPRETPAFRAAEALDEIRALQEKQIQFNETMLKSTEESQLHNRRWTKRTFRVVLATLVATVIIGAASVIIGIVTLVQ